MNFRLAGLSGVPINSVRVNPANATLLLILLCLLPLEAEHPIWPGDLVEVNRWQRSRGAGEWRIGYTFYHHRRKRGVSIEPSDTLLVLNPLKTWKSSSSASGGYAVVRVVQASNRKNIGVEFVIMKMWLRPASGRPESLKKGQSLESRWPPR